MKMENWLPLLILLACPLMMLFMMRGMSHGHGGGHAPEHQLNPTEDDDRDVRLAELEREVATLRAGTQRPPANAP
jgi:hypothetical protein